ncbi:GAF and ANTAR domain-containing protein [Saccharothrix sp. AJ9571]|nr:GAF and ANTAR domain-containing protein [Saccharothrix sp. AJ9571]
MHLDPLAQQFTTLTHALLGATTTGEVLQRITDTTLRVVPGADLVSITLCAPDGTFHTPVTTHPVAARLDQLQYELGEGPCVDAAKPTGPAAAISADLATEPSWPEFGPAAAGHGLGAVMSTALIPSGTPALSGALNIYSHRSHGLGDADQTAALLLATHASLALAQVTAVTQEQLRNHQLRRAIDSRDVIGQAKGILMARRGLTPEEAFDLLRRTSQDLNVKLAELADTLVRHHTEVVQRVEPPSR